MNLPKIIQWRRHSLVGFLVVAALASGQVQAREKYRVYFGTYSGKDSKGIYQCEMNLKDGSLSAAHQSSHRRIDADRCERASVQPGVRAVHGGEMTISLKAVDPGAKNSETTTITSPPPADQCPTPGPP